MRSDQLIHSTVGARGVLGVGLCPNITSNRYSSRSPQLLSGEAMKCLLWYSRNREPLTTHTGDPDGQAASQSDSQPSSIVAMTASRAAGQFSKIASGEKTEEFAACHEARKLRCVQLPSRGRGLAPGPRPLRSRVGRQRRKCGKGRGATQSGAAAGRSNVGSDSDETLCATPSRQSDAAPRRAAWAGLSRQGFSLRVA